MQAARDAEAADPLYLPAKISVARALLSADQPKQALASLDAVPDIRKIIGARTVRAKILLALGRVHEAIDEAKSELDGRGMDYMQEPDTGNDVVRDAEETLG